jgi:AP-1-like transcription factor
LNTTGFDWLAQQNGGQFDPQLFGDYRESQENILTSATFDDSFFNDALDADFFTPYNVAPNAAIAKKNLIAEIDAKQNADDDVVEPKKCADKFKYEMWYGPIDITDQETSQHADAYDREKLQNCPKVQSGEFDLDGLCSELQKKAKCSGSGPVVEEQDFKAAVRKFMGKDGTCIDAKPSPTQA